MIEIEKAKALIEEGKTLKEMATFFSCSSVNVRFFLKRRSLLDFYHSFLSKRIFEKKKKKCEACNEEFIASAKNARFCNAKCWGKVASLPNSTRKKTNREWHKYNSLHAWIRFNFGSADHCDFCGKTGKEIRFEWSNKDHSYTRELQKWWQLCKKCHCGYDKLFNSQK